MWPAFAELRRAARATKQSQLQLVVSALVADARVVFGSCLTSVRGLASPSADPSARPGGLLHLWIRTLLAHGHLALSELWHWPHQQCQFLYSQLSGIVAPAPWALLPVHRPPVDPGSILWDARPRPFPASLCAFFHALRVGAPWALALDTFACLPDGHFSADGRTFALPALRDPGTPPGGSFSLLGGTVRWLWNSRPGNAELAHPARARQWWCPPYAKGATGRDAWAFVAKRHPSFPVSLTGKHPGRDGAHASHPRGIRSNPPVRGPLHLPEVSSAALG